MVICSFCGNEMPRGTGKMYVKKDGKIFYFCSMKCEKNMNKLGRKPLRTKWTKFYKKGN
jgi:large subunit ribosomal protein L24e